MKFFKADSLTGTREEIDTDRIVVITEDGQEFQISDPSPSDSLVGLCIMGRLKPLRVYPFAANKIIVEERQDY